MRIKILNYIFLYSSFFMSSLLYANNNYVPFIIEYDDFKKITKDEFSNGKSTIDNKLELFDEYLHSVLTNVNNSLYNENNLRSVEGKTNNSFTISVKNRITDKKTAVSFIRKYNLDYGGCIIVLDYDNCEKIEGELLREINILFKNKAPYKEFYTFFYEHEISHLTDGVTYSDDIDIIKEFNVYKDDYDLFRRHYLEVYADMNGLLNMKASNDLIDDVIKARDVSYFTNDNIEHHTSLYIENLKDFDYTNHNINQNKEIINNIFRKEFSYDFLKHDDKRVLYLIPKLSDFSVILSRSKYEYINKISYYINLKIKHL